MSVVCNLNVLDHLFVDYHLAPVIAGQIMGIMISILFFWSFLVWKRYKSDNALSKLVSKVERLDYKTIKEWFIRNRYDYPPECKYVIAYASPEMLSFLGIDNKSQIVSEKDVVQFFFEKRTLTCYKFRVVSYESIDPKVDMLIEENDGYIAVDLTFEI